MQHHSRTAGVVCIALIFSLAPTVSSNKGQGNSTEVSSSQTQSSTHNETAHTSTTKEAAHTGTTNDNGTANKNITDGNGTKVDGKPWWKEFLEGKSLMAFAAGAGFSGIVCSACFCMIGLCSRRKQRKRRDEDKEKAGSALVMVESTDEQRNGSTGHDKDDLTPLQAEAGQGEDGAIRDVDYATIDVSQLKRRDAVEGPERSANTDYAEIRKKRKDANGEGEEGDAENSGAVEQGCAEAEGEQC